MSRRPSAGWPRSGAAAAGRKTKIPRAPPRRRDPMPRPLIHRFLLAVSRVSLGGANQARALPPARRRHRSRVEGEGRGGGGSRDGRAARNGGVPGGRAPPRRWGKSPSPASWGADSPAQAGASRARPGISARRVPVGRPRERSRGHAPTAAAPGRRPLRPGRRRQTKTQPRRPFVTESRGSALSGRRVRRRRARRRQDGVTARRRRWSVDQLELDADQRTEGELGERAACDSQVAAEFDFGDGLDGQA